MVQCKNCGLLTRCMGAVEVPPDDEIGKKDREYGTREVKGHGRKPLCAVGAFDLLLDYGNPIDVERESAFKVVVHRERDCLRFIPYTTGLTPKGHLANEKAKEDATIAARLAEEASAIGKAKEEESAKIEAAKAIKAKWGKRGEDLLGKVIAGLIVAVIIGVVGRAGCFPDGPQAGKPQPEDTSPSTQRNEK